MVDRNISVRFDSESAELLYAAIVKVQCEDMINDFLTVDEHNSMNQLMSCLGIMLGT